jgi:hypothetical protein
MALGCLCSKEAYSVELKKHIFSKEIHFCQRQEQLENSFPVRIQVVLKGILPANHSFQGREKLILFQIGLSS